VSPAFPSTGLESPALFSVLRTLAQTPTLEFLWSHREALHRCVFPVTV